jgi:hypothetical protein
MLISDWIGIAVVIVVIYVLLNDTDAFTTRAKTCSSIDSRCYSTVEKYDNPQNAAEALAKLNHFNITLLRHLRQKYIFDNPQHPDTPLVSYLLSNYNPDNIIENAPVGQTNTSYVDDKGRIFAICLREKESGRHILHHQELLEFVVMHELAHLTLADYGHTNEFWRNFKFLLTEAKKINLHNPQDYSTSPEVYCSVLVDYSPYYDVTLKV